MTKVDRHRCKHFNNDRVLTEQWPISRGTAIPKYLTIPSEESSCSYFSGLDLGVGLYP